MLEKWPPEIYSVTSLIKAVVAQLKCSDSVHLSRALAVLYSHVGQHSKALDIHLLMHHRGIGTVGGREDQDTSHIFKFIEKHQLYDRVLQRVDAVLELDGSRGVGLLVEHHKLVSVGLIPPAGVRYVFPRLHTLSV
jgi:hypothetical protein